MADNVIGQAEEPKPCGERCDQKGKLEGKIKYALGEPKSFEGVFKK